jgi:hypothetical protein
MSHVLKHGVTSIHHMAYTWNDISVFKRFGSTPWAIGLEREADGVRPIVAVYWAAHRAWERKKLRTRIYAAVPLSSWEQLAEEKQRLGNLLQDSGGDEFCALLICSPPSMRRDSGGAANVGR